MIIHHGDTEAQRLQTWEIKIIKWGRVSPCLGVSVVGFVNPYKGLANILRRRNPLRNGAGVGALPARPDSFDGIQDLRQRAQNQSLPKSSARRRGTLCRPRLRLKLPS